MSTVLVAESQEVMTSALKEFLEPDAYAVQRESNGLRTLECLRLNRYSAIVLETGITGLDAISVVRAYRAAGGSAPILLMADKHCSEQLQQGLAAGADYYAVKPTEVSDLAAQVKAMMRRPALRADILLTSGGIAMDTESGTITRDDINIHLHPMEFKLLQFLMTHPDQVFSAHALFERVWQKDYGFLEDTVRTHIRTLRKKIDSKDCASVITTVRGLGYKTASR